MWYETADAQKVLASLTPKDVEILEHDGKFFWSVVDDDKKRQLQRLRVEDIDTVVGYSMHSAKQMDGLDLHIPYQRRWNDQDEVTPGIQEVLDMKMGNPNGLSMISVEAANEAFEADPHILKDEECIYDYTTADRKSSNIKSIWYDHQYSTLRVAFLTGREYEYYHVPSDVVEELKHTKSKGSYFNQFIRLAYDFKEL